MNIVPDSYKITPGRYWAIYSLMLDTMKNSARRKYGNVRPTYSYIKKRKTK